MDSAIELVDLMVGDSSPSEISDKVKEVLYNKASEKLDNIKPYVANAMFGNEISNEPEEEE